MKRYLETSDSWIWWDAERKQFVFSYDPNNGYAIYPFDHEDEEQLKKTAKRYTDMLRSMYNNDPIPVEASDIENICIEFLIGV